MTVEIGNTYGKLKVLEKLGPIKNDQCNYWLCECSCGKITQAKTSYLLNGRKSSCGCLRQEKSRSSIQKIIGWSKLPEGIAAFNIYYNQYKSSTCKRKISFNLTKKDFFEITQKNCHYCNEPPNKSHGQFTVYGKSKLNKPYISNGVDRVDSSKGYELPNVVPCCYTCNVMKNILSVEEFANHIKKIYNYLIREKLC